MVLDHLGIIAGRFRQCVQKYGCTADKSNAISLNLKTVEEVRDAGVRNSCSRDEN
jgi:hypothetical protein